MSTPVIEQIAEDIKTAVDAITVAAGFNETLRAIRPKRRDFAANCWSDKDVIISQTDAEELSSEMNYKYWKQFFALTCIVIDSDSSQEPIDTRLNKIASDIDKKLQEDTRRSNLAIDTDVTAAVPFVDADTSLSGIVLQVSVDYRVQLSDPYSI